ncbi:MAG: aminomethyl-transferring glycine dehydrogenase subunit GcvPA [Terriglobia bacterium]
MRYLPNSAQDRARMLEAVGLRSAEDLFAQIPAELRLKNPLRVPGPLSESGILEFFREASQQSAKDYASFLGAGAYSHYRPVTIDMLLSRGEFFTAYTPYQAEVSQGTLQAMFEFQTLMAQLTGMEVANSSLYDGSTATNEAVLMAMRITRRDRVVLARTLHPEYREVVRTYVRNLGVELQEAPYEPSGQLDLENLEARVNEKTAAVVVQSPNFFGVIERIPEISAVARKHGALLIVAIAEPLSLAIIRPPREADIVCGEAQSFGIPVAFGGPYAGFMATREKFVRQMPGRLVGQAQDAEGRRGFVLTLVTREQFIRREKATSNICTSQSLCALAATIYLCLLGKRGLRLLAEHNLSKAHYAAQQFASASSAALPFASPYFNEFVIKAPAGSREVLAALEKENILGGVELERFYPELKDHLLVCVTETVSKQTIDRMAVVLGSFGAKHRALQSREKAHSIPARG